MATVIPIILAIVSTVFDTTIPLGFPNKAAIDLFVMLRQI
jgi:hypothetical protein